MRERLLRVGAEPLAGLPRRRGPCSNTGNAYRLRSASQPSVREYHATCCRRFSVVPNDTTRRLVRILLRTQKARAALTFGTRPRQVYVTLTLAPREDGK